MAGKPELSASSGVSNVVVYVSNDNFAQNYATGLQGNTQGDGGEGCSASSHPVAPMAMPLKPSIDKQATCNQITNNSFSHQADAFMNGVHTVISQNGFSAQPIVKSATYQFVNNEALNVRNYREIIIGDQSCLGKTDFKVRNDDSSETSFESDYVSAPTVDVFNGRCDSVRSETAESSCSSLSSTDDSLVLAHSQGVDMVVYDPNVGVRPGGVILTVASPSQGQPSVAQSPSVVVPNGWKRLSNNGEIIYISPSNTALNSLDQVKEYLQTPGTCKCGLECPLKYDAVFCFDPKVISKPWTPSQGHEEMTKLCNHKRKLFSASGVYAPVDTRLIGGEYGLKKKRRKVKYMEACLPHTLNSEKSIIAHHGYMKDACDRSSFQQAWPVTERTDQNQMLKATTEESQMQAKKLASRSFMGETVLLQHPNIAVGLVQQKPDQRPPNIPIQGLHCIPSTGRTGMNVNFVDTDNSVHAHSEISNRINPGKITEFMQPVVQSNYSGTGSQNVNLLVNSDQVRISMNSQPSEPSGPGRPGSEVIGGGCGGRLQDINKNPPQQMYCSHLEKYQMDPNKVRTPYVPATQVMMNNFRPKILENQMNVGNHPPRMTWPNRPELNVHQQMVQSSRMPLLDQNGRIVSVPNGFYERVAPVCRNSPPTALWADEAAKKKIKYAKLMRKRGSLVDNQLKRVDSQEVCPNIDVRQISIDGNRPPISHIQQSQNMASPSFLEDPSGYLAQQTALLNSTINRQKGTNYMHSSPGSNFCSSPPHQDISISVSQNNGVPLPSNVVNVHVNKMLTTSISDEQNGNTLKSNSLVLNRIPVQQPNRAEENISADSASTINNLQQCQGCTPDNRNVGYFVKDQQQISTPKVSQQSAQQQNVCHIEMPCASGQSIQDPVPSSTQFEKSGEHELQDPRPIQGGTVSTSNVLVADMSGDTSSNKNVVCSQNAETVSQADSSKEDVVAASQPLPNPVISVGPSLNLLRSGIITTMASGRTASSNTITSVLAGRANTATVSVNNALQIPSSSVNAQKACLENSVFSVPGGAFSVSKSPLEMVQNVVSSIHIPHSQQHNSFQINQQVSPPFLKQTSTQNVLVQPGGQIIITGSESGSSKVMSSPNLVGSNSLVPNASSICTTIAGSGNITHVVPAVGQQVLGQQTVLLNTLPAPFVLQSGVAMAMDGMTVNQNIPISHLVAGNVLPPQVQIDGTDTYRQTNALSPEGRKKCKKRKISSQTVANMLHIATQPSSGVLMTPNFSPQIQMSPSPQGVAAAPVMQALTIVPGKAGTPAQIVMNSQTLSSSGTQQILANSQAPQQINLLQPVNLLNGTAGVVQHFPSIQQFIVPNLGGMVMNPDGTATILQDTSNLGMQLQLQNVNGQNILTPIPASNNVFNNGQSILASPGMVIRTPSSQSGKIIQQPHSPGSQFLSPNGGQLILNNNQFSGQLSPLVANVSPTQQGIRTNAALQIPQEFVHCGQTGQTLMVPCSLTSSTSNQQSTTFVHQNTTIVQQQTTMMSNNQQLQNYKTHVNTQNPTKIDRGYILNPNIQIANTDKNMEPCATLYRQSVSTQTAVNQASQSVTTNTFCQTTTSASSSPDTTTHSPMAREVHGSSPVSDITSNTGGGEFSLVISQTNPMVSNADSNSHHRPQNSSMAMVHCISSSENDLADSSQLTERHFERENVTSEGCSSYMLRKAKNTIHVAYAESSTLMSDAKTNSSLIAAQDTHVTSENLEKWGKQYSIDNSQDAEGEHLCSSLFTNDEDIPN